MRIETLTRYPVKSMLGEPVDDAVLGPTGLELDRGWALQDLETGLVCTAKHPRLWRRLLQYRAHASSPQGQVVVSSPGGSERAVDDPALADELSDDLGRRVRLSSHRDAGSEVERPDPEEVLDQGVEAELAAPRLEIAQGTPGDTFVDYAPVHLITTATLDHLGVEGARYRPNLIVESSGAPFAENDWVGRELHIGSGDQIVVLRGILPTPRCSVPTLEHGPLPRAPQAVRPLMTQNRVDVPGFGVLPCAGVYAEVVRGGTIRRGDPITLT